MTLCLFAVQSCFSPLDQDTVYLRQEGNENSDVEAVLKIDRASHTGVRFIILPESQCALTPTASD